MSQGCHKWAKVNSQQLRIKMKLLSYLGMLFFILKPSKHMQLIHNPICRDLRFYSNHHKQPRNSQASSEAEKLIQYSMLSDYPLPVRCAHFPVPFPTNSIGMFVISFLKSTHIFSKRLEGSKRKKSKSRKVQENLTVCIHTWCMLEIEPRGWKSYERELNFLFRHSHLSHLTKIFKFKHCNANFLWRTYKDLKPWHYTHALNIVAG